MQSVVISIDAELGWGFHDRDPLPENRIRAGRTAWTRLCDLFDRYDIPATWAVVGHLLLDDCDRPHTNHPAGPRCCTSGAGELPPSEVWYAGTLIERVRNATVDHELASHGFTHVHFEHEQMNRAFAEAELDQWTEAAAQHGITPGSFVFPVNVVGYRDLLAEYDFDCYRGPQPGRRNQIQKLSDAVRGSGAPPIVHPSIDDHGLVNVPASQYLFEFEGRARSVIEGIRDDPVVERVERGLTELERGDGVLHLWLHPHNLAEERDYDRLRRILASVARARETTDIQVETMADVAARTRTNTPHDHIRVD